MGPGVTGRIDTLKATISKEQLDALVASGRALSPSAVLTLVAE